MLYRPALHGNWNTLNLARTPLKDKFPTPKISFTTVLTNRQVFLPDPVPTGCLHFAAGTELGTVNMIKFNPGIFNHMVVAFLLLSLLLLF
jgi:hypothetical protein